MTRNMFWFVFRAALAVVSLPLLMNLLLIADAQASTEKVLYSFKSGGDANNPVASLTFDPAGNLYGTTEAGGAHNLGAIFQLTPGSGGKWTETVIYDFNGGQDGMAPLGGVILDASGTLYGTTSRGARGSGTVYSLSPAGGGRWKFKVLHTFVDTTGGVPSAGLVFDTAGNLYGTTAEGGNHGVGSVFEMVPGSNGKWSFKAVHSFNNNGHDGYNPLAPLIIDSAGNLYGTTNQGGAHSDGVVFEFLPGSNGKWTEKILHTFNAGNGHDGAAPTGPVTLDANGNLFGTTVGGGKDRFYGVVFELSLNSKGNWQETILHSFTDGPDGGEPNCNLIFDSAGNIYGTGSTGGNQGVVFKETLTNGKWKHSVLHKFQGGSDGISPHAGLVFDGSGVLYGTTKLGGTNNLGTVFNLKP